MKTVEELNRIRAEKRIELDLRKNTNADTREKHILVCQGTGCTSSKSPQILENFKKIIKEKGIQNVRVIKTGCFGLCAKGPIVIIRPEDTFYARFTLEPKGKYNISVCLGTACFVKGSQAILDRLKERLKLEEGKTSEDGKFSIDTTRCVGACGIAPVFTVNDEVYGHATVKKLDEVLDELS